MLRITIARIEANIAVNPIKVVPVLAVNPEVLSPNMSVKIVFEYIIIALYPDNSWKITKNIVTIVALTYLGLVSASLRVT